MCDQTTSMFESVCACACARKVPEIDFCVNVFFICPAMQTTKEQIHLIPDHPLVTIEDKCIYFPWLICYLYPVDWIAGVDL